MGVHTDTFGKRVFVGAVWGEQHHCTLPSPLDAALRLAVRCSQKEFVPLAQALQSLPQPLQHHDTERAPVWLFLGPATAGDGSPLDLRNEQTPRQNWVYAPQWLPWQNSTATASSPVVLPSHVFWRQCAFLPTLSAF